jgi:hypothetical protein
VATITLEVIPFRAYAPFPGLLPFFKCILEVVICEGVQHFMLFCLDHLSCVKMAAFQWYLQSGGWGTTVVLFLVKKFLVKGSMRPYVVMQQPCLLSPKFGAMSSHIFTQSL